ncbi:MAG: response regulator [Pirellulales bacterium]|nr:response regulator [Pirellulales bacterium]
MNRKCILFVDDEPHVLAAFDRSLREFREHWDLEFCASPQEALNRIRNRSFDTVVLDVSMPGMSGLQLLNVIKSDNVTRDLPVVIVTGESDQHLKRKALELDAADLLNKPVDMDELVARLRSTLRLKEYSDELKSRNETLQRYVRERTSELSASRIDIIWRLGKAAEYRDEETGNHVIRVGSYARVVATSLGLAKPFIDDLFLAAPLHDIGKIGIPDSILLKPGKLSDHEWNVMRLHCQIGAAILSDQCKFMKVASGQLRDLPGDCFEQVQNPVIELATTIAATHHEKWNGNGYPNGLAGKDIPIAGRIVAIADVYDALRSVRPYKQPFSIERSIDIIRGDAGTHFDPEVVEAFLDGFDRILAIETEFADSDATELEPMTC